MKMKRATKELILSYSVTNQKKLFNGLQIWFYMEKQKEMMRNFVIVILFVWAIMIIGYLAGSIASPPTLLLMEIFF